MDLTILNVAKDNLIAKKALAGVMQVDAQKYYIPYDEVLAIFSEVSTALTDLNNRLITAEAGLANRMLCTKYKID
jgi:hypothetical protein